MKWFVIRLRRHTSRPWLAIREPVMRYEPVVVREFHTHAEALAFANAQSRFIEATA